MSRFEFPRYRPRKPREAEDGVAAKRTRASSAQSWWSAKWLEAIETQVPVARLRRGRTYARRGQVLSVEVDPRRSSVVCRVQGTRKRPYDVVVAVSPLDDRAWTAVVDGLTRRAATASQLLAGEMPKDIEAVFSSAGARLMPAGREISLSCSCPDWDVCKHIAACQYVFAERLDADPFLLFALRGRDQQALTDAMASRLGESDRADSGIAGSGRGDSGQADSGLTDSGQTGSSMGDSSAVKASVLGASAPGALRVSEPLTVDPDADPAVFWRAGSGLDEVTVELRGPASPGLALHRLGQPPFLDADIHRVLGRAYKAMTRIAFDKSDGEAQGSEAAGSQ